MRILLFEKRPSCNRVSRHESAEWFEVWLSLDPLKKPAGQQASRASAPNFFGRANSSKPSPDLACALAALLASLERI